MPLASTGWAFFAQLQTSRLWTCCSQMLSPQSQTKWYQLRIWYSISVICRLALAGTRSPPPFQ